MAFLPKFIPFLLLFTLLFSSKTGASKSSSSDVSAYIVQLSRQLHKVYALVQEKDWYNEIVNSAQTSNEFPIDGGRIFYIYERIMHDFIAKLFIDEVEIIRRTPGVIAVYPDALRRLHTTRLQQFIGLSTTNGLCSASKFSEDFIISVVDSGIWPEIESFNDDGLPLVPLTWHGECVLDKRFDSKIHCNTKLIGARYFFESHEIKSGISVEDIQKKIIICREGDPILAGVNVSEAGAWSRYDLSQSWKQHDYSGALHPTGSYIKQF